KSSELLPLVQDPTAVTNTLGKEQVSQDLVRPASDVALREYCDRNYHQLLPIIAEKVHQEKVRQKKISRQYRLDLTSRKPHNTPSQGHRAEEETSRKGLDLDISAAYPEALN
ncbi:hypothetical protein Tco_0306789, partial [Tanacetum coccineum]